MNIDINLAMELGLSKEEYDKILTELGRTPSFSELGVYSVMWSEHCSYKSSKKLLATFPNESDRLLAAPGEENAGALTIDDDWAVVFKVESHNHPSAIAPFQGAATGVGGILRDVFAMGARPVAILDSLRFGNLDDKRTQFLLSGVVSGISHYGNCVGVPTIGGEVEFDESYRTNPLVNAMAVGLVKNGRMASNKATQVGAKVIYVGASTGRDGIHGATFASIELDENSQEDLPSVQIGDPFLEKLLIEATLEIVDKDLALAIQDMGAAGLTSSSTEMAHSGGVGILLELDNIPTREENMTPYEMLLSESQERMLIIAHDGKEKEIEDILNKWGLYFSEIGYTNNTGNFQCSFDNEMVVDIPLDYLVGKGVPKLDLPKTEPAYIKDRNTFSSKEFDECDDYMYEAIISDSTIASKRYIYHTYDHQVGTNTVVKPGGDGSVIRIKDSEKLLSMSIDCNGRYCYLNPYEGSKIAVAESIRNIVATGAFPIGITDCLNFASPKNPEVYWTFAEAVRGISDICRQFEIPVTGGNVSFYNESHEGAVYPTPVIGIVGIVDNIDQVMTSSFQDEDDIIFMIGETKDELGGSIYQKILAQKGLIKSDMIGNSPELDLEASLKNANFILNSNKKGYLKSCHDLSDGGLFVALIESLISDNNFGAEINFDSDLRDDIYLLSESQSRYLVSVSKEKLGAFEILAKDANVTYVELGKVNNSGELVINNKKYMLSSLKNNYLTSIEKVLS